MPQRLFYVSIGLMVLALAGCAGQSRTGLVAVLTDYGSQDHYVGVLNANIARVNPDARVVTISHEVEPYNVAQGAFLLAEVGPELPAGTVIVGIVDPGVGTERAAIVVETAAGHLLVGPDNGLFDSLIERDGGARGVYRIENPELLRAGALSSTFHGRDIFAPVAGHLSRGIAPARVGRAQETWVRLKLPSAERRAGVVRGAIVHRDRYGNLLTNIPADWFAAVPSGAEVVVQVGAKTARALHVRTYGDVNVGEVVVLRNASGCLEVARNMASAGEALAAQVGAAVEVRHAAAGETR